MVALPSDQDPEVEARKRSVLISTTIVLIVSTGSYILRLWARKKQAVKLQWDDYFMGMALPFSYIPAACMYYGLSVGLGQHAVNVSKEDRVKFSISLFVLQRGNPPCLFCVKTSILLLYTRIFPAKNFKRVAIGIWLFTLGWAISAFFSNMFQCLPVAYFWNKTIPGGRCLPNALITIGLTNGVLSFAGDLFILAMPIPMIWKLKMNNRRKLALSGMFALGGFVCLTSILRFIALLSIDTKDLTFSQVNPGMWTYVELGIGITSGNLPLLKPIFGAFFSGSFLGSSNISNPTNPLSYGIRSRSKMGTQNGRSNGWSRINKSGTKEDTDSIPEDGSEVELRNYNNKIVIRTQVDQEIEDSTSYIDKGMLDDQVFPGRSADGLTKKTKPRP